MTYSTYLGGTGDDIGRAIAVDAFGSAYITGTAADRIPDDSRGVRHRDHRQPTRS